MRIHLEDFPAEVYIYSLVYTNSVYIYINLCIYIYIYIYIHIRLEIMYLSISRGSLAALGEVEPFTVSAESALVEVLYIGSDAKQRMPRVVAAWTIKDHLELMMLSQWVDLRETTGKLCLREKLCFVDGKTV